MSNIVGNILTSHKFLFYSKLVGAAITGGTFVYFLTKNQIEFYKDQNISIQNQYTLNEKLDAKRCDDEKAQLKLNIENSMLQQYKKFGKDSKESKLFLETIDLLNEKSGK
jgi:hypothetical protein